ncbi:MAG: hypothetical protein AAFO07_34365, partial [Bacteroidota bacterium]
SNKMEEKDRNNLYQALNHAHAQTRYEGQSIWNVFNSMVAVNTLLTAFSVAFINLFSDSNKLILILLIAGIILCCGWYLMMHRMFSYYKYWYTWIRYYENELFSEEYQMINVGKTYSEGDKVRAGLEEPKMTGLSRIVKNETIVKVCISVVSLMYILMLIYAFNAS